MENKEVKVEIPPLPKEIVDSPILMTITKGIIEKNIMEAAHKSSMEIYNLYSQYLDHIDKSTSLSIHAHVAYFFLHLSAGNLSQIMADYKIETEFNNQ